MLFPEEISWRVNRSYMFGEVKKVAQESNEVVIEGYIKQNFLNAKRLVHISGITPQAFHIKRIEIAKDPCPMKISQKEKDKVLSTSKAQSLMSSKYNSRKGSMDSSRIIDGSSTASKAIQQSTLKDRDADQVENNPGAFCAEQTWPTEDEIKAAKKLTKS